MPCHTDRGSSGLVGARRPLASRSRARDGWLAEVALTRATALVWLDLPWCECRDGLLRPGVRSGMTAGDHDALPAWAEGDREREPSSSFAEHEPLFRTFGGRTERLRSRAEVSAFSLAF